jgi:hypothetical protein
LAAGVLLAAVAGGGWFVLTREPDHPLSRRNYRRIVAGMTRAEVAEILGGPPGPVGTVPEGVWFVELVEQEGPASATGMLDGKPAVWYSDRGQIIVMFDSWEESGHVLGKQLYRPAPRR